MDHPVHRYRDHEILCSPSGYTVLHRGVEVLVVGTSDAGSPLADCEHIDHMLEHAERAIDRLIADQVS
ncbi:hypothetical protein FIV34_15070 [Luteibacter pinisoli]|uniref:Uncharacterized protein n=1 Tax=Luteibacter pinisoli TaxID=2589080 RepID=A0A4Y5Z590_9GAMM|nr:hypothetical protein [Luteibacter pinisoli]QDE40431.1 hypothetical protein FIV34_15070 [Luteibacter pinisoli]